MKLNIFCKRVNDNYKKKRSSSIRDVIFELCFLLVNSFLIMHFDKIHSIISFETVKIWKCKKWIYVAAKQALINETWRQTGSCSDFCQYKQTLDGKDHTIISFHLQCCLKCETIFILFGWEENITAEICLVIPSMLGCYDPPHIILYKLKKDGERLAWWSKSKLKSLFFLRN